MSDIYRLVDKVGNSGKFDAVLKQNSLFKKTQFLLQAFNSLDGDHSHFQGNFLTRSPKYLQSNT